MCQTPHYACALCWLAGAYKIATYLTHDQKHIIPWTIHVQACPTLNESEPQPFLYSLRVMQCQHQEGTLAQFLLQQAIACAVKYSQRLQQRRH